MKLNRSIAPDLLVSALLTLLVWFEFWGGRLPASLDGTILIIGVIGGAIVTIVGLVIKQTRVAQELVENDMRFFIIMADHTHRARVASTWVADGSGDRPARGHLVVANGKGRGRTHPSVRTQIIPW